MRWCRPWTSARWTALRSYLANTIIYDPLSGAQFPNNIIPASRLSAAALALLNFYPQPNFSGSSRYNYQAPIVGISNQTNINSRISETINAKNQVSGSFAWQSSNTSTPNLFDFTDTTKMTGINTGVQWTYHFTTRLISSLRYSFSRSATNRTPYFANPEHVDAEILESAGILGNDQAAQFWGPPSLSFSSGIYGLSDGAYQLNHNNTNQAGDSLIWVRGSHNVTFGGDFRRLDFNQIAQQNARGTFTFTGGMTGPAGSNGQARRRHGFRLRRLPAGPARRQFDRVLTEWSGQVLPRLVGGRFRHRRLAHPRKLLRQRRSALGFPGPGDRAVQPAGEFGSGPAVDHSDAGLRHRAAGRQCRSVYSGQSGRTAGFAGATRLSRVSAAHRDCLAAAPQALDGGARGLWAVLQHLGVPAAGQPDVATGAVVEERHAILPGVGRASAVDRGRVQSAGRQQHAQTFALDPNFRIGYIHYWQALVQQNLRGSFVATFTYSGNKGTHQVQEFLPWTFPAGDPLSRVPARGYVYETSNGNSNYNAVSAQLQHRFHNGFLVNATYVFSKAIDDAQTLGGRGAAGSGYAQNWLDLSAERSLSSFNRTNTLNLSSSVFDRHGDARRNADQRMERRAVEGLDAGPQHDTGQRAAGDSDRARPPDQRNRHHRAPLAPNTWEGRSTRSCPDMVSIPRCSPRLRTANGATQAATSSPGPCSSA